MGLYQPKAFTVEAHKVLTVTPEPQGGWQLGLEGGNSVFASLGTCGVHTPAVDDYWIMRLDGDNYLCPAAVFNEKYEPQV